MRSSARGSELRSFAGMRRRSATRARRSGCRGSVLTGAFLTPVIPRSAATRDPEVVARRMPSAQDLPVTGSLAIARDDGGIRKSLPPEPHHPRDPAVRVEVEHVLAAARLLASLAARRPRDERRP